MADSERLSAPGCWLACTSFSRTKTGLFLFAEIVLCLVTLICFSTSTSTYSSLSMVVMIFAAVLFVFYMCDLHSKISFINWPWTDFFRSLVAAILYLITSIVVLVDGKGGSRIELGCWVYLLHCSLAVMPTFFVRARTLFPKEQGHEFIA